MIPNKDLCIDSENGKIVLNGDKYDLGTQGEIDTAVKDVYSVMGQMGAKNLIPYPYVNTTQTINNVDFTDNGDGSISVDNAASTTTQFRLYGWTTGLSPMLLKKGTYILSGCPSGGDINSIRLYLHNQDSSINIIDDGEGTKFTLSNDTYVGIAIRVANGYDADGKTVYPMIRLASDTDNTYEPYAMTNKQLTGKVEELAGAITYTDITVNKSTTGYAAPVESAGGVYYEALATYAALDIPKDKILNIILVDQHDTAKSFNYYLGAASVGVLTDSAVSIYKDTAAADLTLRIVYKN